MAELRRHSKGIGKSKLQNLISRVTVNYLSHELTILQEKGNDFKLQPIKSSTSLYNLLNCVPGIISIKIAKNNNR